MSDLTDIQSAETVKIAGASSSGVETNFVNADSNGSLQTASRTQDGSGTNITSTISGTKQALDVNVVGSASGLPAATFSNLESINSGVTTYSLFTASQNLAIKQFYAGGTGIGKQTLYSYIASTNQFVTFGDFESTGDVSNWVYTTNGGSGTLAFSTAQFFTGSGSMSLTFTSSDQNHLNGAKQTFSTPIDVTTWRYISAQFYNTVSAGGAYTRNIAIILTDSNSSTRTYLVTGSSTVSPFNTAGWVQILGEITNPTSSTGTAFDASSITSIELRQWDSANKAGTVYWDTVKLSGQLKTIFPIYHAQNTSFNILIDPVFVMNTGDTILIAQTNNDTARKEYYASADGVAL